ncbi:MAG TPA: arylsulfatase [Candidatus Defluviicoccus seviourii]|nr:arylsulfatase [Candidatus Defluviicoccus seviourii]
MGEEAAMSRLPADVRLALLLVLGVVSAPELRSAPNPRPNIVVVLCDDLGYGDIKCNNPRGKIATPHADSLAAQGMRFTDAHTTSSVCTPTRYSLMTGRYNWRSRLQKGVLGGLSPHLIEPGRLTVAALLKRYGYHTACIGKWHLGMDWAKVEGKPEPERNAIETAEQHWSVDFARPIANGPANLGFDYFFGISASLDMVPYTFIENDRVVAIPTVEKAFPMVAGKPSRTTRCGPAAPEFEAEAVLPSLARAAVDYIGKRAAEARAGTPFFLYFPLNAPHTPIAPSSEWRGKSGLNPYADFVMQTDAVLGQILEALAGHELAATTLVVFTSDNGCSPEADIASLRASGHDVSGPLRGHKADIWDGGHRVPFIVRWPGVVRPGTTCDQVVSLVDLMATCADIVGATLPDEAGEDSVSMLSILRGKADTPLREALVHHSIHGNFALRQGQWKLALCPGSGGWSRPGDAEAAKLGLPAVQLYDMAADRGEQTNVAAERPEIVDRLTRVLEKYVRDGRSTPGAPQRNDTTIDLWKSGKP